MIAIIDYGAGNLFSVQNALDYLGEKSVITRDSKVIESADGYILPGVGAFPYAKKMLDETGLVPMLKKQVEKKPLLGICLGMQMLFDKGYEFEECDGLGLIPGSVDGVTDTGLKIPHMGWNSLDILQKDNPLLKGVNTGDCVYFVHSYMATTPSEYLVATASYGVDITAITANGNVYGTQFHPEKSGEVGLMMLKNFGGLTK